MAKVKITLIGYIRMLKQDGEWKPEQVGPNGKPTITKELPEIIVKGEKYVPQYSRG